MTTEAQTQHAILAKWGSHPRLTLWRQNTGAAVVRGRLVRFGVPGCADILGAMEPSGRFVAIEVKAEDGVQSPEQIVFQRMIERRGGVYILARSVAEVDRVLIPLVGAP